MLFRSGNSEKTNLEVVTAICTHVDKLQPDSAPHSRLISFVKDRPGHDRRYAIDTTKIESELGWQPKEKFETGLHKTVNWYFKNMKWVENVTSGAYRNWIDLNYGKR